MSLSSSPSSFPRALFDQDKREERKEKQGKAWKKEERQIKCCGRVMTNRGSKQRQRIPFLRRRLPSARLSTKAVSSSTKSSLFFSSSLPPQGIPPPLLLLLSLLACMRRRRRECCFQEGCLPRCLPRLASNGERRRGRRKGSLSDQVEEEEERGEKPDSHSFPWLIPWGGKRERKPPCGEPSRSRWERTEKEEEEEETTGVWLGSVGGWFGGWWWLALRFLGFACMLIRVRA